QSAFATWSTTGSPQPHLVATPALLGLTLTAANRALAAAGLNSSPFNSSSVEFRTDFLQVLFQSPDAGKPVPAGSTVGLRVDAVGAPAGIGTAHCHNVTNDRVPVHVWVYDGQWRDKATIAYDATADVSLGDGLIQLAAFGPGRSPPNDLPG